MAVHNPPILEATKLDIQPSRSLDNDLKTPPARFQRRIIVDSEMDVLPIVCAVSRGFDKVVIYMHCALPSVPLYQKIVRHKYASLCL